jgi:hypothetical protein
VPSFLALPLRSGAPAFIAAFLLAGCSGDPGGGWAGTVDTTATGVVVVENAPVGSWASEEAWRVEEVSRVGAIEGDGPDVFGRISFVGLDPEGRSWVYDGQAGEMRVFAADGEWVRNVGRAGEGPGEFANPSGLAWDPEGRAWIMDPQALRVSVFDTAGAFLTSYRMPGGTQRFPWPGTVDVEGRLWDQGGGLQESWLIRFDPALAPADSFPVPQDPRAEERSVTVTTQAARMTMQLPFAGSHVWRLIPEGGVWTLLSESYLLSKLSLAGDTLRRVRVPYETIPVTAGERAEAVEQWSRSMGDLDLSLIPDEKPPTGSFVVDDRGYLWVSRTSPTPAPGFGAIDFDVLDPRGQLLGRIELPWRVSTLQLQIRGEDLVAVTRDELGVEYLVRARIVRPD